MQQIKWHIETRNVSTLKEWIKNPRKLTNKGLADLTKSIDKFGLAEPIVINTDGTILGGHARVKVLKAKGEKECDCYVPDRLLTEKEVEEINIRLNANIAGEFEWEALVKDWDVEKLSEWGLEVPLQFTAGEAVEDDFEIPETIKTDIILGDLFEIGNHRLLCGDSTNDADVKKLMNGAKADMTFTDPPYGVNYSSQKETMFYSKDKKGKKRDEIKNDKTTFQYSEILPIIKENSNGVAYIFCGAGKEFDCLKAIKENSIELISTLVWNKPKGSCALGANYKPTFEMFYYCKIGKQRNWIGANNEWTVWDLAEKKNNELHPTQKPVELSFRAIRNHKAEIILDFYLGSGSTMIAANQLNRKCYGMELDEKYCQVIIDRMLKLDPTLQIKKNGLPL